MSSSNCCFLTCIQVSQEAGWVVWYSHLFQNFPQFIVIHTVKGFGIVSKAEIVVFLELSLSMIQRMLAIWSLVPLPFVKPADHTEHSLSNSMKLSHAMWGHPRWMGQGGEVWQNVVPWRFGKPLGILALRTAWTVWKGKKIGHWKMNSAGWYMSNMLLEISGKITQKEWRDRATAKTTPSCGCDW